jgi:hypothetical protein
MAGGVWFCGNGFNTPKGFHIIAQGERSDTPGYERKKHPLTLKGLYNLSGIYLCNPFRVNGVGLTVTQGGASLTLG